MQEGHAVREDHAMMRQSPLESLDVLHKHLVRLRGNPKCSPDASIIMPVNAQGDLENVLQILSDITRYSGKYSLEVIFVINNYPPNEPPHEIETYGSLGLKVVSVANVRRAGEAAGFTARMPGLRAASAENAILFDADCRIPNPSALLDWYIHQLKAGVPAAYTHVGFHNLPDTWQTRAQLVIHHGARWIKRVLLGIPTTRGSNYAVNRSLMLEFYDKGVLADEMNVGPTFKAFGRHVAYLGAKELKVLTSGRMLTGRSWIKLFRYYIYRFHYNLRVLPVRPRVARYTKRENDPVRRYENNRPVKRGFSVVA